MLEFPSINFIFQSINSYHRAEIAKRNLSRRSKKIYIFAFQTDLLFYPLEKEKVCHRIWYDPIKTKGHIPTIIRAITERAIKKHNKIHYSERKCDPAHMNSLIYQQTPENLPKRFGFPRCTIERLHFSLWIVNAMYLYRLFVSKKHFPCDVKIAAHAGKFGLFKSFQVQHAPITI